MFVLSVFIFILLTWVASCEIRRRRFVRMVNQFDGPPTQMLFGNSLMFSTSATEIYKTFIRLNNFYKNQPYRIWLLHKAYVVIHYLNDARIVSKMLQKEDTYKFIADITGDGLITSSGEKWKKTRTIMDPNLNGRILNENMMSVFNVKNSQLIQVLKTNNNGMFFNLRPYIYRLAIFTLYENIMGFEEEKISDDFEQFLEDKDRCCNLIVKRIYSPWLHPHLCFKAYLYATGQTRIFSQCRSFFEKAIQKKKQLRTNSINNNENNSDKRNTIIDILMDTHKFSDSELTDEILTLLYAGTETTCSAVCFTLLMLAMQPDIQNAVYEEIHRVFGDSTRLPSAADLSQLTFLEQCIKETLRKFTIVSTILRKVTTDTELADGRLIPAGANVYLSLHGIHHNPHIYPNPDVWDPRNFDSDKIMNRPANSFLPFGLGPRMCLGYKYAMMSIKTTLTMMVQNFKITTNQTDLNLDFSMVLKSKEGYSLKLTDRTR